MQFGQMEIRNFLAIGEMIANLSGKGLVLIQGENLDDTSQDSNGSGKSSFPDALSWCLYGVTAREETGDGVVNQTAGEGCMVSVEILDGNERYIVSRYRKHKKHKNSLQVMQDDGTGTLVDRTLGTDKLTQGLVDKIVGCSMDVFNAAIYAGQEQMPDLPGMTDKFLKQLVEEAAGVNRLQAAHVEATKRERAAKDERAKVYQEKEKTEQQVTFWAAEIERHKELFATFETDRRAQVAAAVASARTIKESLTKLQAEHDPEAIAALERRIDEVKGKIAAVEAERVQEQSIVERLTKARGEATRRESALEHVKSHIAQLVKSAQGLKDQVGKPCGECGKLYQTEDLKGAGDALRGRASQAKDDREAAEAALEEASQVVAALEAELTTFRASMTDTTEQLAALNELTNELAKHQAIVQSIADTEAHLQRELKAATDCKDAPNPHQAGIDWAEEKHKEAIAVLDDVLTNQIPAADAKCDLAAAVAKVFSPAGVRAHILDTVTPFLNDRTAHYLGILSDGNIQAIWTTLTPTKTSGELREKFQIDVKSATGGDRYKKLSGGEKRKVRLATALALQDLVASRATKPIELFIGDEIDDALDESGLERLMTLFGEKAREKGTVLAISHNSLASYFRNTVTVRKQGGFATLVGSI